MRKLPAHILARRLACWPSSCCPWPWPAWIAPYPPAEQDLASRLSAPSGAHWLGTDHLGRDTLSRLLDGGRFSLTIAALATVLTAVIGTAIGVLSARRRGWLDEFFTRTNDVLLAMPEMVVALFLVAALGAGYPSLLLALTVTGWTPFARLARALAYDVSARGFIEAARVLGCSPWFTSAGTSCRTWPGRCWDRPRSGSGSS